MTKPETGSLTDRAKLLLIAESFGEGLFDRHGNWVEVPCTWANIVAGELRRIAGRMDDAAGGPEAHDVCLVPYRIVDGVILGQLRYHTHADEAVKDIYTINGD